MGFTNAWDETYPSDAVIALNYGDALRDDRVNERERIAAFGAGIPNARETPEAVFGDANKGVRYFSVDDRKLYRWDGTQWLDVTLDAGLDRTRLSIGFSVGGSGGGKAPGQFPGGSAGGFGTFPGNILVPGSVVQFMARGFVSGATATVQARFGSTLILDTTAPSGIPVVVEAAVFIHAVGQQRAIVKYSGTEAVAADPTEIIGGVLNVEISYTRPAGNLIAQASIDYFQSRVWRG